MGIQILKGNGLFDTFAQFCRGYLGLCDLTDYEAIVYMFANEVYPYETYIVFTNSNANMTKWFIPSPPYKLVLPIFSKNLYLILGLGTLVNQNNQIPISNCLDCEVNITLHTNMQSISELPNSVTRANIYFEDSSDNNFHYIPKSITILTLNPLSIKQNIILELPSMNHLSNLKTLYICDVRGFANFNIEKIPINLEKLSLAELDLDNENDTLEILSSFMEACVNLQELDLFGVDDSEPNIPYLELFLGEYGFIYKGLFSYIKK